MPESPAIPTHFFAILGLINIHAMKNRLFAVIALCLMLPGCGKNNPILEVEGGKVQGVALESGITVYRGIPFAAAPIGELRWKEPQPVIPWEGVRMADSWGAPAMQAAHTPGGYTPEFFFEGDPEFSEDCLYLNVWTPAAGRKSANLPVCLWIHGGGYMSGWGFEPEMDGEEWAKHGCILVSFNYRLGLLGFLTHPALSAESPHGVSGNYGMLDQIAALKWVKNNIRQFGGNPDKVTIMGQSAGAMSVQTLCTSPLSKDLIAGAIIQSGGGISDRPLLGGTALAESELACKEMMDWAGCTTTEQMRAVPAEELISLPMRYFEATKKMSRAGMAPVKDAYALPETFSDAVRAERIADVPYLIGSTLDDMPILASGISDFCFEREKAGNKAYAYQFARRLPSDGRKDVLEGAFHSSELWYSFKSLRHCWRPFVDGDYDLAEQMIVCWTNFVKFGTPDGDGPENWAPFTREHPSRMIFRLDENGQNASGMEIFEE